jgi:hypothetical protein
MAVDFDCKVEDSANNYNFIIVGIDFVTWNKSLITSVVAVT